MPKVYNKHHKDAPDNAVYVGRPSVFGNPFRVSDHGINNAVDMYREYFYAPEQEWLREHAIKKLKDKDLVCFCKPKRCHADILLEYVNGP